MEGLKVFDKEECGKILVAELRHILLALGERLSAEEVDELLKGVEDAEGLVNYERKYCFVGLWWTSHLASVNCLWSAYIVWFRIHQEGDGGAVPGGLNARVPTSPFRLCNTYQLNVLCIDRPHPPDYNTTLDPLIAPSPYGS